jgi:hypothetical protein
MSAQIFVSYSHDEYAYKDELIKYFRDLERNGTVEIYTDEQIVPGQEWDNEIRSALQKADIILFMVSKRFIHSRYINEVELQNAIERYNQGKVVLIPVILEQLDNEERDLLPLQKFESLPKVNKKEVPVSEWNPQSGAYYNIMDGIKRSVEILQKSKPFNADVFNKLRSFFKKADYNSIFRELQKMEAGIRSQDTGLYNAYLGLSAEWSKNQTDIIRGIRNAEQDKRDILNRLLDFIDNLESAVS